MEPRWVRGITAIVVVGLMLGACTQTGGSPGSVAAPEQVTEPVSENLSPLAEFLDAAYWVTPTDEELARQLELWDARRYDLISQCMKESGFEFYPDALFSSVDADGNEIPPDPSHQEYMDKLSESELAAWWAAYWGPDIEWNVDIDGEPPWDTRGCQGWAEHQLEDYTEQMQRGIWAPEEFQPLLDAIDAIEVDLASHAAVVDLNSNWAWCMADNGFPNLENPDNIRTPLNSVSDQELADLKCQSETDYVNRLAEIRQEVESQFVNDHRAELEAFRSAAEQRG